MRFACTECASPAVVLPEELVDSALVHCQGCNLPIATWAEFKQRTTRAILAETKGTETRIEALSYDPLDMALVQAHQQPRWLAAKLA